MPISRTIVAVDFDGTIVDHDYPRIGQPVPLALEWLSLFNTLDIKIVLFTMRSDETLQEAVDYLTKNKIELYGINKNPDQHEWTNSNKAYAHYYVDDAAVGCPLLTLDGFKRKCVDWKAIGYAITGGTYG